MNHSIKNILAKTVLGSSLFCSFAAHAIPPADQSNTWGVSEALTVLRGITLSGGTVLGSLDAIVVQFPTYTDISILNAALTSLAPIVDTSFKEEGFGHETIVYNSIENRLITLFHQKPSLTAYAAGDLFCKGGAWVTSFGQDVNEATRDAIPGYRYAMWGVAIGADTAYNENVIIGAAIDFANARVKNNVSPGSITIIDNFEVILYGQVSPGNPLFVNWLTSLGYNDYASDRNINFKTVRLTAASRYHGWQFGSQADLGYDITFDDLYTIPFVDKCCLTQSSLHVTPLVSLNFSYLDFNTYTETGAGTASQTIDSPGFSMLLGSIGVQLAQDFTSSTAFYEPEIHFRLFYDFINSTIETTSQFTGGGPDFFTLGAKPPPGSWNIGASLTTMSEVVGLVFTVSYDYNHKTDYSSNSGFLRLRYEWV